MEMKMKNQEEEEEQLYMLLFSVCPGGVALSWTRRSRGTEWRILARSVHARVTLQEEGGSILLVSSVITLLR